MLAKYCEEKCGEGRRTGIGVLIADLVVAEGAVQHRIQAFVKVTGAAKEIGIVLAEEVVIRAGDGICTIAGTLKPC